MDFVVPAELVEFLLIVVINFSCNYHIKFGNVLDAVDVVLEFADLDIVIKFLKLINGTL